MAIGISMRKVVFHIDHPDSWGLLISNVHNMIEYYSKHQLSYEIDILANSIAVTDLVHPSFVYKKELLDCISLHVQVVACEHSLKGLGINPKELFENIHTIPSGVVYLAEKQFNGYSYIKP